MQVDFIIVGQGLAGSLMAYDLLSRGKKVVVFDQPDKNNSSSVAAGLFNPITGRRFVRTWMARELFTCLMDFYPRLEQELGTRFFHRIPIYRPFLTIKEQNEVIAQSSQPGGSMFLKEIYTEERNLAVSNNFGGISIEPAGFVDLPAFISAMRTFIDQRGLIRLKEFKEEEVNVSEDTVRYGNINARMLIFCNGAKAANSKFFSWLPFRPVKGELIYANLDYDFEFIFNRKIFILPYKKGIVKVGATYDWDNLSLRPTKKAKKELEEKLNDILDVNFKTVKQVAGIRPATRDRRPFVGLHPRYRNIGIFNGLGSKGVTLGPYFSKKFGEYLTAGGEIENEAEIKRYNSLY